MIYWNIYDNDDVGREHHEYIIGSIHLRNNFIKAITSYFLKVVTPWSYHTKFDSFILSKKHF